MLPIDRIVTGKLAYLLAWHYRQADGSDRFSANTERVRGFEECLGIILDIAPELIEQILREPDFKDWWKDEVTTDLALRKALQTVRDLKDPEDEKPKGMIEELLDETAARPPKPIPASAIVERKQIVPGALIIRYTEPAGDGHVAVAMPCCKRLSQPVKAGNHTRSLLLCQYCKIPYGLELIDDNDDGYWAYLTVDDFPFVTVRRR